MKLRYSTTFHPQTDEQTERQNSILEQYLRSVVNYQQNDCDHVNTDISPFMTYTGRNPKFIEEIKSAEDNHEIPAAKKKVETIFNIKKNLETKWQITKNQQFK